MKNEKCKGRCHKVLMPMVWMLVGACMMAGGYLLHERHILKCFAGGSCCECSCICAHTEESQIAEQKLQVKPVKGDKIVGTVDCAVQNALQGALNKYADTNDTGRAWGVVLEVKTGAIRAMADTCSETEMAGGNCCASCFAYEPGSVMKPFTAAIALDRGVAKIDTLYSTERNDEKYYKLPGDGGHVWPDEMSVGEALVKSSNIVLGKLSYDVGQERMYLGLRSFGFGEKPESGCSRETAGVLPDCRKRPWHKASQSRVGIGQFITVTALQLARGYAILANGGFDVRPYTIEKAIAPDGKLKFQHIPCAAKQVVGADVAAAICRTLERVVSEEGTARRAAVEGIRVAGKTGTAQRIVDGKYAHGSYRASFAGFFPAEDPKYVVVTTFETQKSGEVSMHQGGQRPALAFAEVVKAMLKRE